MTQPKEMHHNSMSFLYPLCRLQGSIHHAFRSDDHKQARHTILNYEKQILVQNKIPNTCSKQISICSFVDKNRQQ